MKMLKLKGLSLQNIATTLARLNKREKAILYVAVTFILFLLLFNFIIYPIYSKIHSLGSQIREREKSINTNLRIISQKDKIVNERRRYASFLRRPASDEEGMTSLLKQVEALANKSSLYVVDMKPGGIKEDKDKTKRYIVNLTGEGQMEQIVEFIYNVENADELLMVEKYQINPKTRESSVAECAIVISKIVMP